MEFIAGRDISCAPESMFSIREIVESTPFYCKVKVHTEPRVGLVRVEYMSDKEESIKECDLKLSAKIIAFLEERGRDNHMLLPLEFGPRWFLGMTKEVA